MSVAIAEALVTERDLSLDLQPTLLPPSFTFYLKNLPQDESVYWAKMLEARLSVFSAVQANLVKDPISGIDDPRLSLSTIFYAELVLDSWLGLPQTDKVSAVAEMERRLRLDLTAAKSYASKESAFSLADIIETESYELLRIRQVLSVKPKQQLKNTSSS